MIPHVDGWLDLPNVLALDVLVMRMLQNATPDSDDEVKPMTYSERVAWLSTIPDSQLTVEQITAREDEDLLRSLGVPMPGVTGG